ncbi:MAG: rhomboid family intramembrane serine protease [Fimbriimonadales bacterium]
MAMRDFTSSMRRASSPVTMGIVVALVVFYVAAWLSPSGPIQELLPLRAGDFAAQPWTLATYPLVALMDFIWFLMVVLWTWSIGGALEVQLGGKRYAVLWLLSTIIGALSFAIGCAAARTPTILAGPLIPLSAITVAWAAKNRTAQVQFMFILPILGQWLGWISAGIVLFDMGRLSPLVGAFCLIPLGFAYLYASDKFSALSLGGKATPKRGPRGKMYSEDYYADAKRRELEREENERLRKLFEKSFDDDGKG